jgi:hypothetical protein
MGEASERIRYLTAALKQTPKATTEHFATIKDLTDRLSALRLRLSGDPIRQSLSESTSPSISGRAGAVAYGHWSTRQMPTETYKNNLEIATTDFAKFQGDLKAYFVDLEKYEAVLAAAGAPYTRGRKF